MDEAKLATKKVEFKVMAGSMVDDSSEAGKHLKEDLEAGKDGFTQGYMEDTSDRLYLKEQFRTVLETEAYQKELDLRALQSFRSAAAEKRKLELHPVVRNLPVKSKSKKQKSSISAVVVIPTSSQQTNNHALVDYTSSSSDDEDK